MNSPESVFSEIYKSGLWSQNHWDSGPGSDPHGEGAPYCFIIPAILKTLGVRRVVDVGCGDGRIMAQVAANCPGIKFIGIDCCREVLVGAAATWPAHEWLHNQLENWEDYNTFPLADAYLMKDVLHHWPTERIVGFMKYFASRPGIPLIATNDNHQKEDGEDCPLGGYRALNGDMLPWSAFNPIKLATYLHKTIWLVRFDSYGSFPSKAFESHVAPGAMAPATEQSKSNERFHSSCIGH